MKNDQERQFEELHKALEIRDDQIRTKDKIIENLKEKEKMYLELREMIVNVLVGTDFGDPLNEDWRQELIDKIEEIDHG